MPQYEKQSILIINPFGIGDVLFSAPLLRRLRMQFKDAYIAYICNNRVAPLLKANKNLNDVFVFDKGEYRNLWRTSRLECIKRFFAFLRLIRSKRFDIAIDLSLGHQYSFFLLVLGVPKRIGYNYKGRGRFLTHSKVISGYSGKHIADYYLDLFNYACEILGVAAIDTDDRKLDIFVEEGHRQWAAVFLKENGARPGAPLFAVIPGGGASWGKDALYKQWPAENFAAVADALADAHRADIILLGSLDEMEICRGVVRHMRNKPIFACGKTAILQFAALIERSALVICNDGGPLHIAVAQGVKTISLFGPVDEKVYGPYPPSQGHVVIEQALNCRPCYSRFKFTECADRRCLLNIRPQDVVKAAEKLLRGNG